MLTLAKADSGTDISVLDDSELLAHIRVSITVNLRTPSKNPQELTEQKEGRGRKQVGRIEQLFASIQVLN